MTDQPNMIFPAKQTAQPLVTADFLSPEDFDRTKDEVDFLSVPDAGNSLYAVGFANSERCIERALRLRYEVFNEELGEGLLSSRSTGLDRDEFDDQMHHLVLLEKATERVIGTYRLQTAAHAMRHGGFYSAREYDLSPLTPILPELVECGRACIAIEHRNFGTVILLWKAIAAYMAAYRMRYLFGCCSLTTLDPDDGWRAMKTLRQMNSLHPKMLLEPTPSFRCGPASREFDPSIGSPGKIPKLFSAYLKLGAQVVSLPAIDREFGTVDFLVYIDGSTVTFSNVLLR